MNKTMHETSPRILSLFFILSTVPTFYYAYKFLVADLNDKNIPAYTNASLTYMNLKNLVVYSSILLLTKMRYHSPTAKFTVEKKGLLGKLAPLVLSIIALSMPPRADSKFIIVPTFMADFSMVIF